MLKRKTIFYQDRQCILVTMSDLTKSFKLKEEQQIADKAKKMADQIKHTHAMVSHNIRAPIETIATITGNLLNGT